MISRRGDPLVGESALARAEELVLRGEFDEARVEYQQALVEDPSSLAAGRGLGVCLRRVGQSDEAVRVLESSLASAPADAATRVELGDALLDAGRVHEAIGQFAAAARDNPESFSDDDWVVRGDRLVSDGRYAQSAELYQGGLGAGAGALALRGLGTAYLNLQQDEDAAEAFTRGTELYPEDAGLWNLRGHVRFLMGQFEEAFDCFAAASRLDPDETVYANNAVLPLLELRRHEEALQWISTALQLDPQDTDLWVAQANVQGQLGDFTSSLASGQRAISLDPKSPWAFSNVGWALKMLGQLKEAIPCFDKAIELGADDASPWVNKASSLDLLSEPQAALDCLNEAPEAIAGDLDLLSARLNVLSDSLGRHDEALVYGRLAYDQAPENALVAAEFAELLVKVGDCDRARAVAGDLRDRVEPAPYIDVFLKFLMVVSYAFDGDVAARDEAFGVFIVDVEKLVRGGDLERWDFRGLAAVIDDHQFSAASRFLLCAGIDLQRRTIEPASLSCFGSGVRAEPLAP